MYTDVAEVNLTSVGETRWLVTLIEGGSGHLIACHLNAKGKAAESLKPHIRGVDWQTNCLVKKIAVDTETIHECSQKIQAAGIQIYLTASSNPEENERVKRMTSKNPKSDSNHASTYGTPANLWEDCLFATCVVHSDAARAGRSKTSRELLSGVNPTIAYLCTFWGKVRA